MKILAMTVLVLLPALILAGLAHSVYRRGAFTEITSWWRGASGLILESDKVLFEPDGNCRKKITCDSDNNFTFSFYGDTPSTEMNDATIALKTLSGETLVSTNLTVLWVEISMRCGQGDSLSPDNDADLDYLLGTQQIPAANISINGIEFYRPMSMSNVAEFSGWVSPSNFVDDITLVRDAVGECSGYVDPTGTGSCTLRPSVMRKPGGNDTGMAFFRDDNPAPNGTVFDVDTPGLILIPYAPLGRLLYARYNFLEYAVFNGIRCSDDYL